MFRAGRGYVRGNEEYKDEGKEKSDATNTSGGGFQVHKLPP
jgi:hypothetical protein